MHNDGSFIISVKKGLGFGLGLLLVFAGALLAQTLNTFNSGDVVSSSLLNANFTAVKGRMDALDLRVAPIGGIIAWHKSLTGVPTLPAGWVECDGSVIVDADSPLNGQTAPNLNAAPNAWNGGGYYLRGAATSGASQVDTFQGHRHYKNPGNIAEHDMRAPTPAGSNAMPGGPAHPKTLLTTGNPITDGVNGTPRTNSETRPVTFTVVWIMRIK